MATNHSGEGLGEDALCISVATLQGLLQRNILKQSRSINSLIYMALAELWFLFMGLKKCLLMYASSSILGVLLNHLILQDSVINYLSQQILWSQHSDYNSVLVTYCVNYVLLVANDKCCL